eukprot:gnl/MRDRNA2_/MRDRNA2_98014_c0_seq1.p1 gnl/MRDRNA2_/MRDRNA2_98014_c0~~gnl/MRDRNA2_/MRDRNA2_98014_c0_seq1.p1  ORF type:complete len:707 (-),score=171.34 gnl/MRDRNA2_/MRDRNA2_98014_c0_seq1:49-2169(-)
MASMMSLFVHLLMVHHSFGVQYVDPQQSSIEASGSTVALMRNQRPESDLGEVVGGWVGVSTGSSADVSDEELTSHPHLPDEEGKKEEKKKAKKSSDDSDKAAEKSGDKHTDKVKADSDKDMDAGEIAAKLLKSKSRSCAPLTSHGTYYTVDLQVGTPGQTFSVVADTGSDAVIVPSCVCTEGGACNKKDRCFRGTNKSLTFSIAGLNHTTMSQAHRPKLPVINMFFGSGEIRAIVASDIVNVGGVKSHMKNSVMLMVDQALRISGVFEGILGLGPPKGNHTDFRLLHKEEPAGEIQRKHNHGHHVPNPFGHHSPFAHHGPFGHHEPFGHSSSVSSDGAIHAASGDLPGALQKILKDAMEGSGKIEEAVGDIVQHYPSALEQLSVNKEDYWPFGIPKKKEDDHFQPMGFNYASKVSGFSMCFNDMGAQGALHLGVPRADNSLLSVGYEHWGLDFQGISVGDSSETAAVKFCNPNDKKEGQTTACGAIPDSGTTLFMAPMDHIHALFGELCDRWERCKTAVSQGLENEKMMIFRLLLHECSSWVAKNGEKNSTLHELPDLHFRLAGKDGKKQTITMTGDDYIIETMEDEVEMVTRNIFGMPIKIPKKTGKMKRVCAPAFSVMEMETKENGKVWIMGAPLFYKYTISYDNDAKKPSIAFNKHKSCGCPSEKKKSGSLVSSDIEERSSGMRELHQAPRLPSFALQKNFRL